MYAKFRAQLTPVSASKPEEMQNFYRLIYR
jgi:hypothetical protein